jgi:anti-sigma regulatory factor (Ser/Thr protein kinase)
MNTTAAFAVDDATQVAEARRAASLLADRLGYSAERAGQVALVVTELGTNLARHAQSGEILLRALDNPAEAAAIEVLALDKGPGIPDIALSRRDGYSTAGTPGNGLGAIERQSDHFEIYTQPAGTAVLVSILRDPRDGRQGRPAADALPFAIGAVQVTMPGESICGDAWSWRTSGSRLSLLVADGLGHGLAAHEAAREAAATFERTHAGGPLRTLEDVHAALRAFRGAAVAVLAVDLDQAQTRYAGLGNIASVVLTGNGRHSLVSHNGIAGHTAARLQEFTSPFPPASTVVMHTDGLGTHWNVAAYPGLRTRHPSLIAGVLYRDFARRRDDVTVVVVKIQPSR